MDKNLTALKQDTPTDARQVRSRKALNCALLALLNEKAFDELTIREITARASTGYATFFRHFPTKEALLSDLASEPVETLLNQLIDVMHARKGSLSPQQLCATIEQDLPLWSALLTGGASAIVRAEFLRKSRERTSDLPPTNDWLPVDLALVHGVSSIIGTFTWWLRHHAQIPAEQVATIIQRMVLDPLSQETLDMQLT